MGHSMTHQAHDDLLRKLRISVGAAQCHLPSPLPGLFALTDPERTPNPIALATQLFEGCGIIYRHFGAANRTEIATRLSQIAQKRKLILLIGNDPELALAVNADGVHWPEANMDTAAGWSGKFRIMTAAAHNLDAIARARRAGMDAVLVSAVFPSRSPSAGPPIGVEKLRQWTEAGVMPVYGLGGVTADNFSELHDYAGAAMIGALSGLVRGPKA